MVKKYGMEVGAGMLALGAIAFLIMAGNMAVLHADAATQANQTIVRVDQNGKVLVRGVIDSITSGSLVVKSWGGSWTANIGVGTQIMPAIAGDDIAQFKPGDYVGVQGTMSLTDNWTVDATLVRDWTYGETATAEKKQNVAAAKEAAAANPKNYIGTASGVNGSAFMLTIKGTANTVNVADNAEIVNRNWITMPLESVHDGDTVRVWGVNASGTIAATIVRDTSLPATSTPAQ